MTSPPANFVRTVLGDVPAGELGRCYCHEHVLISSSLATRLDPDLRIDDPDIMAAELESFTSLGGRTVVDMMPPGIGRDATGLVSLARRCGINLIAATGFHRERYYDEGHWLYHYSTEQIADLFVAEIMDGMDRFGYRGPLVARLAAQAGVIKCATDYYRWTAHTEKWFEAAGLASLRTGAPISTHTEHGSLALEQVTKLLDLGVPAESIIIGHLDRNPDPGLHAEIAATGVFLEYDGPSRLKYHPDSAIVALIARAAESGYDHQLLLGSDLARRSYFPSYGGGPGFGYLLGPFAARLRKEGLGQLEEVLFVHNPARALAFVPTVDVPMPSPEAGATHERKATTT
jgi:phosphotriesterase-related protein